MILREVMLFTYVLIAVLNLAVGGELFGWLWSNANGNCHKQNEQLLMENRQGPLRHCLGE